MKYYYLYFFLYLNFLCSQSSINTFLKPSDTLHKTRFNSLLYTKGIITASSLVALNQIWYNDYPRSNFQFKNDNNDWLQMDKAGHFFSGYHLSNYSCQTWQWAGLEKEKSILYGTIYGMSVLTAIEVMDGYSSQWGFSWGDMLANVSGGFLFASQEYLWNEQRIIPKFSFYSSKFASIRPELLGSTTQEQLFKDYNAQTYWLSVNLNSFIKNKKLPNWFCFSIGYGGDGMITANETTFIENNPFLFNRNRQFYLSFDIDFNKIKTNSHVLKTFFSIVNCVKIPAPTFEISTSQKPKFHWLFF